MFQTQDEDDILASKLAAVGREVKAASAAVFHDRMLFQVRARVCVCCALFCNCIVPMLSCQEKLRVSFYVLLVLGQAEWC